jgi:hypothetical protein
VILAHFTGNDTSSFLLVVGLGALVLGARRWTRPEAGPRRTAVRLLVGGVVAMATGITAGLIHTGLTSPAVRR